MKTKNKVNIAHNIRLLQFCESSQLDSCRFRQQKGSANGQIDVQITNDIDVLLEEQSFQKQHPDFGLKYLLSLRENLLKHNSNLQNAVSSIDDDILMQTIKPRHKVNSIGEIIAWCSHNISKTVNAQAEIKSKVQDYAKYKRDMQEKAKKTAAMSQEPGK